MLTKSYQSKHYPQYSPVYIRVDRLKSDEIFLVASKLQINNRISFVYTTLKTKCTPWPLGHWDLAIRENIPPTQTIFCIQNEATLPIRGEKNPFCFFFLLVHFHLRDTTRILALSISCDLTASWASSHHVLSATISSQETLPWSLLHN